MRTQGRVQSGLSVNGSGDSEHVGSANASGVFVCWRIVLRDQRQLDEHG